MVRGASAVGMSVLADCSCDCSAVSCASRSASLSSMALLWPRWAMASVMLLMERRSGVICFWISLATVLFFEESSTIALRSSSRRACRL